MPTTMRRQRKQEEEWRMLLTSLFYLVWCCKFESREGSTALYGCIASMHLLLRGHARVRARAPNALEAEVSILVIMMENRSPAAQPSYVGLHVGLAGWLSKSCDMIEDLIYYAAPVHIYW